MAAGVLALAAAPTLHAQTRTLDPCQATCDIEMTELVRLGEPAGEGFVGTPAALVRRSDGRGVLVDRDDRQRLTLFDARMEVAETAHLPLQLRDWTTTGDGSVWGFVRAGLAYSEGTYDNMQPYVQAWRLRRAARPPG